MNVAGKVDSLDTQTAVFPVNIQFLRLHASKFVGGTLHNMRVREEKTQEEVASKLSTLLGTKIDQSYVSKVETGGITISFERFFAFCQVYDWKPSDALKEVERYANNSSEQI